MPAMGNILLRKDDATEVAFGPVGDPQRSGVLEWRSNVTGLSLDAQQRVTLRVQRDQKTGRIRINHVLTLPIMEVIPSGSTAASGYQAAPRVADVESISTTYYLSPRGSNETRADLVRQNVHLIGGAGTPSGNFVSPTAVTADTFRDVAASAVVPYGIVNLLLPYA